MPNQKEKEPATDVQEEGNALKFYYCKSEDDYYLGQRVDNFYYAKYDKDSHSFIWCMSRYLPWGKHIVDKNTLWKEHTYPSQPIEIGFSEWLKGFIAKYITADVKEVRRGRWFMCSKCGAEISTSWDYDDDDMFMYCPCCGARMDGKE